MVDEKQRKHRGKRVVNSIPENEDQILSRPPVRIEILSSAENTQLLDKDLHELLGDASNCCEFSSYVDRYGETFVKIDCVVTEDEKERVWDLMRFKHKKNCVISSEPI
jgi:hypothetical protein